MPLIKKTADFLNIGSDKIAEILITEYPVGAVINWHRDAPSFDIIAGISLDGECKFKLRPHDKRKQMRKNVATVQSNGVRCIVFRVKQDLNGNMAPPQFRPCGIRLPYVYSSKR